MNRYRGIRVMTMAWLLVAASPGVVLAQHVVGGMGEPVRMGAFDGRGLLDNPAAQAGLVSGKGKGKARHARATDARHVPGTSTGGAAPTLPGRRLP